MNSKLIIWSDRIFCCWWLRNLPLFFKYFDENKDTVDIFVVSFFWFFTSFTECWIKFSLLLSTVWPLSNKKVSINNICSRHIIIAVFLFLLWCSSFLCFFANDWHFVRFLCASYFFCFDYAVTVDWFSYNEFITLIVNILLIWLFPSYCIILLLKELRVCFCFKIGKFQRLKEWSKN